MTIIVFLVLVRARFHILYTDYVVINISRVNLNKLSLIVDGRRLFYLFVVHFHRDRRFRLNALGILSITNNNSVESYIISYNITLTYTHIFIA